MFISTSTFSRRLAYLVKTRSAVLSLGDALERRRRAELPDLPVVITIDDGFYSTLEVVKSQLAPQAMPATLYVTSYYADKQTPIFRLVVAYIFWKTEAGELHLASLVHDWSGVVNLEDRTAAQEAMRRIVDYGERELNDPGRCELALRLGHLLGVDYQIIVASRLFSLLKKDELRELEALGVDIELHTHRHRLPLDEAEVAREIGDNRMWLGGVVRSQLEHFCYPSGDWSPEHPPWLAALGVKSAVTCDVGLNGPDTPHLALRRWLDDESVSQIEFEAEVSGYAELLRQVRARAKRLTGKRAS
ncbi:MAG TPA: polysaccharide deacetylase family protein [Pirellulales bacterium]|nr:polysaccharide deacetylase family protein [Pirellulales bacterium]